MKFQDDISNERMDTRLYGQAETNMLSNFFNVASIKIGGRWAGLAVAMTKNQNQSLG